MEIIIKCDNLYELHTLIGKTPNNGMNNTTLKEALINLKKNYASLSKELCEIKAELTAEPKSKPTAKLGSKAVNDVVSKPRHISTYRHYDNYKLERKYDKKKGRFFVSENRPFIDLNFLQLVAIIKGYKNGLTTSKMKVNPILSKYTTYSLQDYIYIWRAGGFNQAIKDYARSFGYNPNKLLSYEVE